MANFNVWYNYFITGQTINESSTYPLSNGRHQRAPVFNIFSKVQFCAITVIHVCIIFIDYTLYENNTS